MIEGIHQAEGIQSCSYWEVEVENVEFLDQ